MTLFFLEKSQLRGKMETQTACRGTRQASVWHYCFVEKGIYLIGRIKFK
jgi:hypothetical protein